MKEISLDDLLAGKSNRHAGKDTGVSRSNAPYLSRAANLGRTRPVTAIAATAKGSSAKKFSEPKSKPAKVSASKSSLINELLGTKLVSTRKN